MRPKTDGILESSLCVSDVARSVRFYQETFGFSVIREFGERGCATHAGPRQALLLSRRGLRAQSHRLTRATANCTSRSQFQPMNCPTGSRGSSRRGIAAEEKRSWESGGSSLYFRGPRPLLARSGHSGYVVRVLKYVVLGIRRTAVRTIRTLASPTRLLPLCRQYYRNCPRRSVKGSTSASPCSPIVELLSFRMPAAREQAPNQTHTVCIVIRLTYRLFRLSGRRCPGSICFPMSALAATQGDPRQVKCQWPPCFWESSVLES